MVVERVTREHIRNIKVGEIGLFTLPNKNARFTAMVQFSMMRRRYGYDFERVETNDDLSIAYRRTK